METWLNETFHYVGLAIEVMAVLIIAYASLEAFFSIVGVLFKQSSHEEKRAIYLRYLRWLVTGLTFQLAADIVHTAVAPNWEQLGHVAAIALIRTFLGYFLERDMREASEKT